MQVFEQLSWLWISIEVLGALAVIVGVWGEEYFDHKVLPYFKQERLKSRFWIILLVGLAIDLIGVVGTQGQAGESAIEQPHRQIRALHVACAD